MPKGYPVATHPEMYKPDQKSRGKKRYRRPRQDYTSVFTGKGDQSVEIKVGQCVITISITNSPS